MNIPISFSTLTIRRSMQLELLISSLLPVAAVFLIGTIGAPHLPDSARGTFLTAFVLCAVIAFVGEILITLLTQYTTRQRVLQLTIACQDYIAGNTAQRIALQGDDELTTLAQKLNLLFDMVNTKAATSQKIPTTMNNVQEATLKEAAQLRVILEDFVRSIHPVLDGDLRPRAKVTSDVVGVAADIYNYLIEELSHFIQQVQSTANQVLSSTRDLLDRSIDLAQVAESQMFGIAQTTEKIEALVTFIQRLSNTIQLSIEATTELSEHIQESEGIFHTFTKHKILSLNQEEQDQQEATFIQIRKQFGQLQEDVAHQQQLFASIGPSSQEHTSEAEVMVGELYTLAQQTHQASMRVLSSAERISGLAVLAEKLRDSTSTFQLATREPSSTPAKIARSRQNELMSLPSPRRQ